jgi:hypothetical protein
MQVTKEMQEMMERTMEQYFAAYWEKHATPEQEAKRVREGKTFKGAYEFCKSVAEKYRGKANGGEDCVAMPDDLAYWILMEYMEHEEEGAKYRTPDEIEAEAKRKEEEAARKRKEAEEKAKKLNDSSLVKVSAEDILEAERKAAEAKEQEKAVKKAIAAEKAKAEAVAKKVEAAQMSLFD